MRAGIMFLFCTTPRSCRVCGLTSLSFSLCDCNFASDRRTGVRKTKPARGMHARARTHAGEAVRACACTYMRGARLAQGPRHSPETRGPFECKGLRKARDALPTDKRYVRRARRWKRLYDSRRNELRDIPRLGTRGRTIFRSRSISRCESDESRTIRIARAADIRFVLHQAEREHGVLRILAVCDRIAHFSKERESICVCVGTCLPTIMFTT